MTYWVLQTVDVGFDESGHPLRAPLNPWGHTHLRSHTFDFLARKPHTADNTDKVPKMQMKSLNSTSYDIDMPESSEQLSAPKKSAKERAFQAHITISVMFTDLKYINEFFAHLSREFSMECLLAMIEFMELQQYILLHMQQYKNFYYKQYSNLTMKNNVSLPRGIPRSSIVYGDNEELVEKYLDNRSGRIISVMEREQVRVRLISYQLYKKYVAIGSEWEINISYETRGRLTAKLHNFNVWMSSNNAHIQMWQLVQLFEDSKHEMYRLLRHSFARFKRGEGFEKITNYYKAKMMKQLQREAKSKHVSVKHQVKSSIIEEVNLQVDNDDIINELKHAHTED